MKFTLQGQPDFLLNAPKEIMTPRLLVFEDRIRENIQTMRQMLVSAVPERGLSLLCAHVKTHKSMSTLKLLTEAGVRSFKCSLNEVDLCLAGDVDEIFVAYPLLDEHARWLAGRIQQFPGTRVFVQFGSMTHAEILRSISRETGVVFEAYLDIDVGMHRTGIDPEQAAALYEAVQTWPEINVIGLHGYDGHIHHASAEEREAASAVAMGQLCDIFDRLAEKGHTPDRVLAAGSPSFPTDLAILSERLEGRCRYQVSPGTWIYWDSGYDRLMPGQFRMAAVILARVLERHDNCLTLNLGHKRWAADQGMVDTFSIADAEVYSFNEEHTVLAVPETCLLDTGDYVLIAPKHVCSTVNLWESYALIGDDGEIINGQVPVDARNR